MEHQPTSVATEVRDYASRRRYRWYGRTYRVIQGPYESIATQKKRDDLEADVQLFLRVPMYTRNAEELKTRDARYQQWLETHGFKTLKEDYGFQGIHSRALAPNQNVEMRSSSEDDPVRVLYPKDQSTLVPKGLLLRLEIMAALDWIDDEGSALDRKHAYFVVIDGSGAFDFDNVFQLVKRLLDHPRPEVVLGQRPKANVGMPPWRRAIELFEEFLLLQERMERYKAMCVSHPNSLPDSQAGCWALCLNAMKSLPITAESYEIEFDLLASALDGNVKCAFTDPLAMQPRGESDFGKSNPTRDTMEPSLRKLFFIQHKLGLTTQEIVRHLHRYLQDSSDRDLELPAPYIDAVKKLNRGGDSIVGT